jgi:hypothetical protein
MSLILNDVLKSETAIVGCDSVKQVEECAELTRSFTPLSQAQTAILEARVEPIAKAGALFPAHASLKIANRSHDRRLKALT